MGAWGTGISSNDTFSDVYDEFIDLYNDGLEVEEITKRLINENQDLIDDHDDKHNFWFALAKAQWDCGKLDKKVLNKVKEIVKSGEDIDLWKELGSSNADLKKRKKALDDFLEKISMPREKPKKRKKKVLRDAIFNKGDCLTFKLKKGNYGGAFILEAQQNTEFGLNVVAVTAINQKEKPTTKDFKSAEILVRRIEYVKGNYRDKEQIGWFYAEGFKKAKTKFEVVGTLKVNKNYSAKEDFYSFSWDNIPLYVDVNDDYVKRHGKPKMRSKLKKWIGWSLF